MTLAEFLLARIAEDEAVARAASMLWGQNADGEHDWLRAEPAVWESAPNGYDSGAVERTNGDPRDVGIVVYDEGSPNEYEATHIARHDPARVLAECAAKRRIVEEAQRAQASLESQRAPATDAINGHVIALRRVVRQLAATYAAHPDYDKAWRP